MTRLLVIPFVFHGVFAAAAIPESHRLGPGDEVSIVVAGETGLSQVRELDATGGFQFPLLEYVEARDLTATDLGHLLAQRLINEGFLLDPRVDIIVQSSPRTQVFVEGPVEKPGRHPLPSDRRLRTLLARLELLPQAGPRLLLQRRLLGNGHTGVTELIIERSKLDTGFAVSRILNVTLEPGDALTIERSLPIRVVSTAGIEDKAFGGDSAVDLRSVLVKATIGKLPPSTRVAVVDRLGSRVDVWSAEAKDIQSEDARALRSVWPGNVCYILEPGHLAVHPARGTPRVVKTDTNLSEQDLRSQLGFGILLGQELRWYSSDGDGEWMALADATTGSSPGVVVGIDHTVPPNDVQ